MTEAGEASLRAIVQAAEISNPKRLYFLQQEVKPLSVQQLISTLPCYLNSKSALSKEQRICQHLTKVIELCQVLPIGIRVLGIRCQGIQD